MGGGSCAPGSMWYSTSCGGSPGTVPGTTPTQNDPPLCPVSAPPGYSNLLAAHDLRCRPACADTIPRGHQGEVVDVQSTNSNAACYLPPMCSTSAPFGYLGTIVPIQGTDPNAQCYLAPMCRDRAPSGYLGRIIPVQSTDPGGNCYHPPVCSDIAPPGYLGQTITVQNTDPGGMCYVTSLPPLCQGVAPVDYPGQVIPTQSTDRNAPCFVTALACTGHIHTIAITYSGTGPLDGITRPGIAIGGGTVNLDLGHVHPVTSGFESEDGEVYSTTTVSHSPAIPDPAGEMSLGCISLLP